MRLSVGTSGYSYKEWKGNFYPEKLPAKDMLEYYAGQLPAVEINNTFYRMPRPEMLKGWAERVPETFRFSIKASRRITHFGKLEGVEEETRFLLETAGGLGERLGVILFQLPPNFPKDLPRLGRFVSLLPEGTRAAFEFRHPSWADADVSETLHARNLARVVADDDDRPGELEATADWGYLRLRRTDYGEDDLARWSRDVLSQNWSEAFVFFKHEDEGTGPRLARSFLELSGR
ncbi:MAG: DUF72 domain-containing protein [Gemmatimonadetes bacterium]|nr:DUF72 domain-containing protein [Gemmatimonadota bacterium]